MHRLMRAAGGVLLATAGIGLHAQEPLTFHVDSKLVSLDVVVTDAEGHPAAGLTRDDFTVLEDGKPQTVRNFDGWQARAPAPTSAKVDQYGRADWGDTPLTILVLDQISTDFADSGYAADRLTRYLEAQPSALPVPTMLMFVSDQGYHTLAGFTRDRDALVTAVKKRPPVLAASLARGDTDKVMVQTFIVLQQIALAVSGMKQHKSIIWVGSGFPAFDPADLDEKSEASLHKAVRQTVDLLMDAHTTVYKIDPTPSATSTAPTVDVQASLDAGGDMADIMPLGEDPLANNFNFNQFAVSTGGQYFYGQNDLDRYFDRAIEQSDEFYTLTYRPPDKDGTEPEKFRNIVVKVNRPGLKVVTRQGYYSNEAPEPVPTNKELGVALSTVAMSDMSFSGVGVRVLGLAAGTKQGSIIVTYQMDNRSLTWMDGTNGTQTALLTVVLADIDAKHDILGSNAYRLHPYLTADHANERFTGNLIGRDEVEVSPKAAGLRLIVRDASGRIGTAKISVDAFRDLLHAPVTH